MAISKLKIALAAATALVLIAALVLYMVFREDICFYATYATTRGEYCGGIMGAPCFLNHTCAIPFSMQQVADAGGTCVPNSCMGLPPDTHMPTPTDNCMTSSVMCGGLSEVPCPDGYYCSDTLKEYVGYCFPEKCRSPPPP